MNSHLGTSLSSQMLIAHALMVGVFDTNPIDFVIWSLVLEMRLSLLFPCIYWVLNRLPPWRTLVLSIIVGALATYVQRQTRGSSVSLVATLECQMFFVIGALMSKYEQSIRVVYLRIPKILKVALFALMIVFYGNSLGLSATFSPLIGATGLFGFSLCSESIQRFLNCSIIQWLGRISYSLYLCHAVVLLLMVNLLYPRLSFLQITLLFVPTALVVATVVYYVTERPAIYWSRAIGVRLGGQILSNG
jgi:peptidoglycan/LPS O-acetylase OafA/YrhL